MSFEFYLYHISNNIGHDFNIITAMGKDNLQIYLNEEDRIFAGCVHDYIVCSAERVNLTKDNVNRTIYFQCPLSYVETNVKVLTKKIYDEYLYLEQFCINNNVDTIDVTIPKDYGDFLDCKVITEIIE